MKKALSCGLLLVLGFPLLAESARVSSDYLFVWAMEAQHPQASAMTFSKPTDQTALRTTLGLGNDFLAVFDVRPGPSFGKLVATLPVGNALQAHHTNYAEPPDNVLYANDWLGNRTYVFDLHDATHPRLLRKFGSVGAFSYPHSFVGSSPDRVGRLA